MADKIQLRGDTRANWLTSDPVLAEREFVLETDTEQYKVGDGVKKYSELPYKGASAVQVEGNSLTSVISQKVVTEALEEVRSNHTSLFDGENIAPELIDPMQGRYTYVITPKKDNTANWKGDLAPIGTDDFMIEFACGFNHAGYSNPLFNIGTVSEVYGSAGVLQTFCNGESSNPDGTNEANWLNTVYFERNEDQAQPSGSNSIHVSRMKLLPKFFHIVIGRSGVNAWVLLDGDKTMVTQDRVLEIANNLTIANASRFALLRKFDFEHEDFAQFLYNGGRWMERVIGDEYKSETVTNISGTADITEGMNTYITRQDGGVVMVENFSDSYEYHFYYGDQNNKPLALNKVYEVKIDFDEPLSEKVYGIYIFEVKQLFNSDMTISADRRSAVALVKYRGASRRRFVLVNTPEAGVVSSYIKNISYTQVRLENEYLPSSLTKTAWRDTAGNSDLIPTNADKMTFRTEPLLQEKLWGSGAPTFAPDVIGQEYFDTTNDVKYNSFGTTNANDWK